jgi:hypothetical protein
VLDATAALAQREIVQMCWMVDDIEKAVNHWVDTLGAGPFFLLPHIPYDELTYRDKPAVSDQSSAGGQWGSIQVELLQLHDQEPSSILEMQQDGHVGVHHVTWFASDMDQERERLTGLGFDEVMTARLLFANGMRIAWYDTHPLLGCMVEVYEENDQTRRFYRKVAQAAEGWDGNDRLRSVASMRRPRLDS